ncbi:MAG: 5-formyltetrahydrofolate cyclo-ligase [Phycisphaerae bacterium]
MKKALRQRIRKILGEISPEAGEARSLQACHRLVEQPEYVTAEVVMVFLSLPGEIDTSPVVLRCWQDGKRVLAPKISWSHRRMMPVEIRSLTDDLTQSQLGMREPVSGIPFPVTVIDLVLVPGLGFDEFGHRLGRGRGLYDRFLAHPEFEGVSCALAFEAQMTPSVPVGPLDRQVDMLVTDEKVRRFKK